MKGKKNLLTEKNKCDRPTKGSHMGKRERERKKEGKGREGKGKKGKGKKGRKGTEKKEKRKIIFCYLYSEQSDTAVTKSIRKL